MENFIYSVDATFPIFLVMVIGYILKQIGMLNDNFVTVANRFNFKVITAVYAVPRYFRRGYPGGL